MHAVWGAVTDAGGRRAVNEDALLAAPPAFLVADGMGGHLHGAMASATVVAAFDEFARTLAGADPVLPQQVQTVVRDAQHRIRAALADAPASAGEHPVTAGSTVAGAILTRYDDAPYWLVFNVGDSRVYRYADGTLTQVSVDHSVVQELIDSGAIDDAQARVHPQRNVITRAVGSGSDVEPDFWMLYAGRADRLLICSDGLVNELAEDRIRTVLGAETSPQQAAARLVREAVQGNARDNVSVVVVDLELADGDDVATTAPRTDGEELAPVGAEDTVPRDGGPDEVGRDIWS